MGRTVRSMEEGGSLWEGLVMAFAKEKTEDLHGTNVNVDSGYCKDV